MPRKQPPTFAVTPQVRAAAYVIAGIDQW
jgi:hypothetical protein